MQLAPFTAKVRRRITEAIVPHGYAPFGNQEGLTLVFRSLAAWVTVEWDRGYLHVLVEPRGREEEGRLDDDLFRQAVDAEAPNPDGGRGEWTDVDAFVAFLRERLPELTAAAVAPNPELADRIAALRSARAGRQRRWLDNMKATPEDMARWRAR